MASVLVVEDNDISQKLVGALLENEGHTVELATSGEEAIEVAKQLHPSLILMDIGLPGTDGIEVARMMKSDAEISDIPVVMLSGHAMADHRVRAKEAGVNDFLTKPFEIADFVKVVRRNISS